MIKMSGRNAKTGRGIIVLGIEERNVEQLKLGRPIHIDADDFGFDGVIVIHYEPTMEALLDPFKGAIGEETRVRDQRNDKRN